MCAFPVIPSVLLRSPVRGMHPSRFRIHPMPGSASEGELAHSAGMTGNAQSSAMPPGGAVPQTALFIPGRRDGSPGSFFSDSCIICLKMQAGRTIPVAFTDRNSYFVKNRYTVRDISVSRNTIGHELDTSSVSRLRTNAREERIAYLCLLSISV